ncbi:MAG: BamA/TamA family outer membrane protein [Gemmatimonadales bacterium]
MRTVAAIAASVWGIASPALGQLPDLPTLGSRWTEVQYPKLYYTIRDGFTFGMYYAQQRPMGFEDYWDPEPYHGAITVDGRLSTSGRRELMLEARLPKLVPGWRAVLTFEASRRPRDYYFGMGNSTSPSRDSLATNPRFYDSDNTRIFLRGELQRRIIGGLRVLGGFHAERWRLNTPEGPSRLVNDQTAGLDPTIGRNVSDITLRVGVVFDVRDDEVAPRRGVLLQAIHNRADSSLAGQLSYTRTTFSGAAYASPHQKVVLAARVLGQTMGGMPRVGSYALIESSDRPFVGIGGEGSHRALTDQRFLGPDKLLLNADARYDLMSEETLYALTAVAFLDAGRVFDLGGLEFTTRDLHVGGGAGIFVRWRRVAVLGSTVGVGPDGIVFHVHSRWAY